MNSQGAGRESFNLKASGPLKKNSVSGPAAGCVYNCRMGTFFFHFAPPKNVWVKISSFSYKKRRRKTIFFKGGLINKHCPHARDR